MFLGVLSTHVVTGVQETLIDRLKRDRYSMISRAPDLMASSDYFGAMSSPTKVATPAAASIQIATPVKVAAPVKVASPEMKAEAPEIANVWPTMPGDVGK